MMSSWKIYEDLIDGIPSGLTVDDCVIGLNWTMVRSGENVGLACTLRGHSISGFTKGSFTGRSLREAAALCRSWNMIEATVGMAACNCFYNTAGRMRELGADPSAGEEKTGTGTSVFDQPLENMSGKKVAVVGHFPYIERQLGGICELSVLERDPEGSDYMDSACEYLLPEQDYVFITGMTFTNKTLPRLLELCRKGRTVLVGPSSPITPVLFDYGVDSIAGFYVTDQELAGTLVSQAAHTEIFRCGRRIVYADTRQNNC
ncbi:MAG: DUF364 domain-containing protein [Oscillospiraceae bacterium]|nr:DUF364 domain-containing protein [Oscillospiraceae bacterium]